MKLALSFLILFFGITLISQARYDVASGIEFNAAHELASSGDSIVWKSGVYSDTRMDIDKNGLTIAAQSEGTVLFKGASRVVINADSITFTGLQYVGGAIGNLDVIRVYGSDILITQVNIQNYTSHKYLVVDEDSRRTTISYCNFENRLNLDDKNILSILVDNEPGYHKIQHCSFKNFNGIGQDQGIEPIRIGVSTQGDLDSRTLVEYCYFTKCNGDGEIISHKSRQNVYRYNTFENNPLSELVLRHGDEGMVYGNFFINNMGGIRIREGTDHYIFNNYFEGLDRRSIYLMNDPVDPLSRIHIYHNTIINSEDVILGSSGNNPPTEVFIANNVFANPIANLFSESTKNETWINNFSLGNLGIDRPVAGLIEIDARLTENSEGFYQPDVDSPALAAAGIVYPTVPLYPGMDYDHEIMLDLMQVTRPLELSDRAIGASEYSTIVNVQPHATEMNTGPSYLFDNLVDYIASDISQMYINGVGDARVISVSSNIDWTLMTSTDWITASITSGSEDAKILITVQANNEDISREGVVTIQGASQLVEIKVFQDEGELVSTVDISDNDVILYPNPSDGQLRLKNIETLDNKVIIECTDIKGHSVFTTEYSVSNGEVTIDSNQLNAGIYLIHVKALKQSNKPYIQKTLRFVKN